MLEEYCRVTFYYKLNNRFFNNNFQGKFARNDGRWKPDVKKGECGFRTGAYTILGGEHALQGEFPFMASLVLNIFGREEEIREVFLPDCFAF